MKVRTFFAMIAAKNQKEVEGVRECYKNITADIEGNNILREQSREAVMEYLNKKHILLKEEHYRRIRALSLMQLSPEEIKGAMEASYNDDNDQGDKMKLFLSNTLQIKINDNQS